MGKKAHPLAARIKRIMQKDEDVGKIAQATPLMIARAMEVFLQKLCENSNKLAAARSAKAVTTSHLKAYVMSDPLMDFLKDTVASAPDLPAEDEEKPEPKLKRQRTSENVGRKGPSKAAKTEAGTKREPHVKPEPPSEAERPAAAPANSDPAEDAMVRTSSSGGGAAAAAAACAPAVGRTATALLSSAPPSTSAAAAGAVLDGKQPVGGAAGGLMGLQAAHPLLGGLGGRTFGRSGGSKSASKQVAETEARHSSSGVVKQAAANEGAAAAAAAAAEALHGAGPFGQQAGEPLPGEEAGAAAGDADMQDAEAAVAGAPAGMPVAGVLNLAPFATYNRDDPYDDDYDS